MPEADQERSAIRVLLVGAFPPQSQGIPGYCGGLAEALATHGHVASVLALGFRAMYPRWLFPGVRVPMDPSACPPSGPALTVRHVLAWYNPLGWWWHTRQASADLCHIQWWSLPLFPVCLLMAWTARRRGLPVVVTVHNARPHEPSPLFLRASRCLLRYASHVFVHSAANQAQLETTLGVDPHRISVVPMGITTPPASMPTQEAAREALGVAPGDPLLLFFGTIRPYKGLHTLLAALATVRGAHPEVRLIVAGQPWEPWEQYAAQIASLGLTDNVLPRLGFVPEAEVPSLFAAADLVVLPYTHFDAQSAVGAQALGFGRPLLVTRTGGLPDLVDDDPAWCVAPDDAPALAMALLRFLEDPEENQAAFQRIRARCVARMSWPESAQHHVAQYARLLADR